jgi:hypothetical protein
VHQVVGDLHVLRAGLVGLRCPDVEIAERVARVPVARLLFDHPGVLGDGQIELALPEQLFRFLECLVAFAGQEELQILSNSVGGRNDRRWASE